VPLLLLQHTALQGPIAGEEEQAGNVRRRGKAVQAAEQANGSQEATEADAAVEPQSKKSN
jgi:hypothetical protein